MLEQSFNIIASERHSQLCVCSSVSHSFKARSEKQQACESREEGKNICLPASDWFVTWARRQNTQLVVWCCINRYSCGVPSAQDRAWRFVSECLLLGSTNGQCIVSSGIMLILLSLPTPLLVWSWASPLQRKETSETNLKKHWKIFFFSHRVFLALPPGGAFIGMCWLEYQEAENTLHTKALLFISVLKPGQLNTTWEWLNPAP